MGMLSLIKNIPLICYYQFLPYFVIIWYYNEKANQFSIVMFIWMFCVSLHLPKQLLIVNTDVIYLATPTKDKRLKNYSKSYFALKMNKYLTLYIYDIKEFFE